MGSSTGSNGPLDLNESPLINKEVDGVVDYMVSYADDSDYKELLPNVLSPKIIVISPDDLDEYSDDEYSNVNDD